MCAGSLENVQGKIKEVLDGNVTMTAVSEICKASGSVHFVSDG
jgi:hypothetical protein